MPFSSPFSQSSNQIPTSQSQKASRWVPWKESLLGWSPTGRPPCQQPYSGGVRLSQRVPVLLRSTMLASRSTRSLMVGVTCGWLALSYCMFDLWLDFFFFFKSKENISQFVFNSAGKLWTRSQKLAYTLLNKLSTRNEPLLMPGDRVSHEMKQLALWLPYLQLKQLLHNITSWHVLSMKHLQVALVFPNNDPVMFMVAFYGCLLAELVPVPIEVPLTRKVKATTEYSLLGMGEVWYFCATQPVKDQQWPLLDI